MLNTLKWRNIDILINRKNRFSVFNSVFKPKKIGFRFRFQFSKPKKIGFRFRFQFSKPKKIGFQFRFRFQFKKPKPKLKTEFFRFPVYGSSVLWVCAFILVRNGKQRRARSIVVWVTAKMTNTLCSKQDTWHYIVFVYQPVKLVPLVGVSTVIRG